MTRASSKVTEVADQDLDQASGGLHFDKIEWVLKQDRKEKTEKPSSEYSVWIGGS